MADRDEFVAIGKIVKPHGLKGALKVISYAESPNVFKTGGDIFMEASEDRVEPVKIESLTESHRHLIVWLSEVDNRTRAEALTGKRLYIKKDTLPATEEDEFYWFDLIGLKVVSDNQHTLGVLTQIVQTGSNDVYVVKDPGDGRETLVPALKAVVRKVDLDLGIMYVALPDSLATK